VSEQVSAGTLVLGARFNGPARSANGGFTAGSLAERVPGVEAGAVEVTLRRPPPLETLMRVAHTAGTTVLLDGDAVVAEAVPAEGTLDAVAEVPPDLAAEAMQRYPGLRNHPFPTCFSCGPERAEGDGLRIFPGPVDPAVRSLVASTWLPHESHAEVGDVVDGVHRCGVATTWAALDCVGGWSEDLEGRPCVLGRMTARLDALPVVGEPHVVIGRHLGREGRRSFTASTLYDSDGRVVATARHTWVQVDPSRFN
jgi:hypothetical protein